MEMAVPEVGARVSCEGYLGTIKYIGEVPPTTGTWWGIEWDDDSKGKHNGSHNGIRYFQTTSPNSGSFVRPSKCSLGISLLEAVRQRYVSLEEDVGKESNSVDERIIGTLENKEVLFVGMSNILREQRSLNTLKHVNLRRCDVSFAGILTNDDDGSHSSTNAYSKLPSASELDLSENLFSDWDEITNVIVNLPSLKVINLQGNVFSKSVPTLEKTLNKLKTVRQQLRDKPNAQQQMDEQGEQFEDEEIFLCHKNIKEICLNNLSLNWESLLCLCAFIAPSLETLVASLNIVSFINLNMHDRISKQLLWQPLSSVTSLNLEGNPIGSWREVLKLDLVMPSLKTAVLNSCDLHEVDFSCNGVESVSLLLENGKTKIFAHLSTISLSRNSISSWESINELNRLQSLRQLNMKGNPIDGGMATFENWGHKVVARIAELTHLNRVKIDRFDRRGAEIDYLKACAPELNGKEAEEVFMKRHPRYQELVDKYGAPDAATSEVKVAEVKAGLLNINIALVSSNFPSGISAGTKEQVLAVVQQRLPKTMTVGRLKMTIKRLFKRDLEKYYQDSTDDFLYVSYSSSSQCDLNLSSKNHKSSSLAQKIVKPGSALEIPMDDLFKEIGYYSLCDGDTMFVRCT